MNYLIIYMSHHGTTQKIAEELREKLGKDNTRIINLENEKVPAFDGYHTILIGGSIHAGQIQKKIKALCQDHEQELLQKSLGLFLCFMDMEHGEQEFNNAFPEILRKHAIARGLFGGELLLEKMNFIERLIVKTVGGTKESVSKIDHPAIEGFVRAVD